MVKQDTVMRHDKRAILNMDDVRMERSKSDLSSYDNRGTEKVSAYKSINRDDAELSQQSPNICPKSNFYTNYSGTTG